MDDVDELNGREFELFSSRIFFSFSRLSATDQWLSMECSIRKMRRPKSLRPNSNLVSVKRYQKAAVNHRISQNTAVKIYPNTAESIVQM